MQNPMAQGYLIHSQNHGDFTIAPELWLKNQQQQTVLLRYLALPLAENGQTLWLGLDSLTNLSACEAFSFLTGKTIEPVLIESQTLKTALQDLSPRVEKVEENQPLFYSALSQEQPTQPYDEPIIRLLNDIFESATAQKASDIHLEPQADCLQTRFRIDRAAGAKHHSLIHSEPTDFSFKIIGKTGY